MRPIIYHEFCVHIHHRQPITDELVLRIMREAGPPAEAGRRHYTEEDYSRWLALLRESDFKHSLSPFNIPTNKDDTLYVCLKIPAYPIVRAGHHRGNAHEMPLLREAGQWVSVVRHVSRFHDRRELEPAIAQKFLSQVRPFVDILESDFAYGDLVENVIQHSGDDPREKAWPFMILGPELVARYGRERVLSAPAWKVDPLPHGAVWIEVSENPFTATRKELRRVADHLGLEVVGGGGPVPEWEMPLPPRSNSADLLIAGVDIEMPPARGMTSILERFEQGDFGKGLYDPDEPFESFLRNFDVLEGFPRPSILRPFLGRRPSTPREPWQVIVGAKIAQANPEVPTEVPLEAMRSTFAEVKEALLKAGCMGEPAYWTIHEEGEF